MTLRNTYLGKSSYDIDEEEIDLIEQVKKRIDKIEELGKGVECESKAHLLYEKNDEIAAIADKIWNIKKLIKYFKETLVFCFEE